MQAALDTHRADAPWHYVMDTVSVNTAENLVSAVRYVNETVHAYSSIYIVTSAFHYERAKHMVHTLAPHNTFHWILGLRDEPSSAHWESVFMRNVRHDLKHARIRIDALVPSSTFHAQPVTPDDDQVV